MAVRRVAFTLFLVSFVASGTAEAQHEWAREDPTKIATAESCGECHVSAYDVWKRTPHAKGFKTLHRLKTAEAISGFSKSSSNLNNRRSSCVVDSLCR